MINTRISAFFDKMQYNPDNIKTSNKDFDYTYIVNNESIIGFVEVLSDDETSLKQLHNKYWNLNEVPITVVFTPSSTKIYNNYDYMFDRALLNVHSQKQEVEDLLSNHSIFSGKLLNLLDNIKKKNNRVDEVLLKNLEALAMKVHSVYGHKYDYVCNAISWCIFIKYLEDRKILTPNTFSKFNESSFINIMEAGKLGLFSQYINEKLQGDLIHLFSFNDNDYAWTLEISKFFQGDDIRTGQMTLFGYDFSIIPVELISNIYEKFLNLIQTIDEKKKLGNFYTPFFLASHMIDTSFQHKNDIKTILDPACGSGVFLVSAYKKLCKLAKSELENEFILTNSIFGVDVNSDSLRIATLSLYIAYLDSIEPKDVELSHKKLPKLIGHNLINSDFFDNNLKLPIEEFDLIVGNPPWISIKGSHVDYVKKSEYFISDNQIAQSFAYKASDLLHENGISALILTSSILFNNNSVGFRDKFFQVNNPLLIVNLQNLKSMLFTSASAPASIIYFNRKIHKQTFGYYLYQNNLLSNYTGKVFFDYSQIINFPIEMFRSNPELWEKISFGSNFDLDILERIELHPSLGSSLLKYNYTISQGYANPSGEVSLVNADLLQLPLFKDNQDHVEFNQFSSFERIHDKRIYHSQNKLLISRTISRKKYPNVVFSERVHHKCIFNNKFYAIISDNNPEDSQRENQILDNLLVLFNSEVYLYYQYFVSDAWKSTHPEIRMERIKKFPTPKKLFEITQINEDEIYDLYGLSEYEKQIIKQTCDILIKNTSRINQENYLQSYLKTIQEYFFDLTSINLTPKVINDTFFRKVVFFYNMNEDNIISEVDDIYGILSIGDIEQGIITNTPIIEYFEKGFVIIKSMDDVNWNMRTAMIDIERLIGQSFMGEEK